MAESLVKAEKQSMAPAQWNVAWDEFGRRYPRLKRGPALLAFLVFTFLGQSVLGLVSVFYGLLPLVVWLLVFLSTTILAQMFVINFSGKARERQAAEHKAAVKQLTEHKLTFQIDEERSLAYVHQAPGQLALVQVAVAIQFKTNEPISVMEDIDLEIYENSDEKNEETKVPTVMYGKPMFQRIGIHENQELRGRKFEYGFSDWFKFRVWIGIGKDIAPEQLDNWRHRLRLTMRAMNQAPLSATLFFDWPTTIDKPTHCRSVWPPSLLAPKRDHVMGSSESDEDAEIRYFDLFADKSKRAE